MNLYANLVDVQDRLNITDSSKDTQFLDDLEFASREIDLTCHRHFFSESATRYFDLRGTKPNLLDDMLSISAFKVDTERDGTYDGQTWVEETDFWLLPNNNWPKTRIEATPFGSFALADIHRGLKLTGDFGYGDGKSATPWEASAETITVATAAGTTLTAITAGIILAGQTILVESEQIYISAVSGNDLTAERGVNGTTAAQHSAKAASVAQYPAQIRKTAAYLAATLYAMPGDAAMRTQKIGDYSYSRDPGIMASLIERLAGFFIKAI